MKERPKHLAPQKIKASQLIPMAAIALVLLGLTVGSLLLPDRAFSSNENRYLQLFPDFSWQSLMSGDFTKKAEDHAADQILLRDFWMGTKSTIQRTLGKTDINGVWLGEDGCYFAKLTEDEFDRKSFEKNVTAVEKFFAANEDKDCHILLAPTPGSVLYDKLPYGAALYNDLFYDDHTCYQVLTDTFGEKAILTQDTLRQEAQEKQVYYRTDHHWTTFGAYAAYEVWAQQTGHEARPATLNLASDQFRGTLYSKVLLPDSVYDEVYIPSEAPIVSMEADGKTYDSLLFYDRTEKKDVYEVFMGGNYAKAVITTGADTGRSLLLVKDSFANCFIPFITADYDTVTVVDLRYCRENIQTLAQDHTDILVLYEMSNFAADGNLFKLNLNK